MSEKTNGNKMKSSWDELTVAELMQIRDIDSLQLATEDEKNLKVAAVLAGIPYEELIQIPLSEVREYMDNTEFLLHKPKEKKARNTYVINGRKYRLMKDPSEMIVSQYIDFQSLYADGFDKRPAEMLSVFLVPDKHTYNDGYDKEQVINDMYNMSVTEALGVTSFFTKRFQRLITWALTLYKLKIKWMRLTARKEEKEMYKALELEMRLVTDELNSIYGLIASGRSAN